MAAPVGHCPRCSAPLPSGPPGSVVQCGGCGSHFRLKEAPKVPAQPTPPSPSEPDFSDLGQASATPTLQAASHTRGNRRRSRSNPFTRGIVLGGVLFAAIIATVIGVTLAIPKNSAGPTAESGNKALAKPETPLGPGKGGSPIPKDPDNPEAGNSSQSLAHSIYAKEGVKGPPKPKNRIDELVFKKLQEMKIPPALPCSDGVFLRRVFLDVIGTLPTAQEARAFLEDQDPDKRAKLIDKLLERDEYADFWAMKWCDLLRVKSEFPINLWPNAVQAYHRWLQTSMKENLPYDKFARELLTSSGSNFRTPQVNFYRGMQNKEPTAIAQVVALNFMGVRADAWPKDRWTAMARFFAQIRYKKTGEWKEEIVLFDPTKAPTASANEASPTFPDGSTAQIQPYQDPRETFADWLITPKNPWFTRNIANRAWYWLFGRGIIHEPDDNRPENLPANPELLAYLEQELAANRYDMKHLFRLILNSATYQQSCLPASKNPEAGRYFAYYPVRRLEAEVLIDAICMITGTTERYFSPIPEPYTYIPETMRSISLPDASISSSFLEMFGRPPRDTGQESERNNKPTAAQLLHLLNSSHIQRKIEQGPKMKALFQGGSKEMVEGLYLTILSRFPSDNERDDAEPYTRSGGGGRGPVDLAWSLITSGEFILRH